MGNGKTRREDKMRTSAGCCNCRNLSWNRRDFLSLRFYFAR